MLLNASIFALLFAIIPAMIDTKPPTEIRKPKVEVVKSEVLCLAEVVYYESPHEPYEGKLAVATVVMNRVKHREFPKTVCGVVYQRNPRGCQFSWVCGPRPTKHGKLAFQSAMRIANDVLHRGDRLEGFRNVLFFHNPSVIPKWSNDMVLVQQIGNHLFYAPESKKREAE